MILRWVLVFCISPVLTFGQLNFIENKGQWSNDLDFKARVPGGEVAVTSNGFSVYLIDQDRLDAEHLNKHGLHPEMEDRTGLVQGHFIQIKFLGGQSTVPTKGVRMDGYYNYFLGNDTCQWASGANVYADVRYNEIYSGIDVVVSSLSENLKYDFIVKAGHDPNQIQVDYCGLDYLQLESGDLMLSTSLGNLTEKKPVSYQIIEGKKRWVEIKFELSGSIVNFDFPQGYDPCYDLVIDPLLIFSTYSGSPADNWGSTATPGENGTLYSAGVTNHWNDVPRYKASSPFPTTPGAFQTTYGGIYDIAIIKYDSAGTKFLYATYLGGSNNESPHSLVVDKNTKDLLVLGTTSSSNYPTTLGALDRTYNFGQNQTTNVIEYPFGSDMIVSRLSPDGKQMVASTFLGGNLNDGLNIHPTQGGVLAKNYGDEMRGDIITDDAGNVYLASVTSSANFPVTPGFGDTYGGGATDAVVMKLVPDLSSVVWSGFLGGSFFDAAYSIKFDSDQNIVVAGGTNSGDFPITAGSYQTIFGGVVDGWIARIAADGSQILQATYTGTIAFDQVYFVDLNVAGDVFCYGQTAGPMPISPGVYNVANSGQFLQKFSSDLSTLSFSTVFGSGIGIPNISPTAFLVNDCDNIFMSGWGGDINRFQGDYWDSGTEDMEVTSDALDSTTLGSDFYFIVLNDNATELVYATFLGGNKSKTHVDGGTSRFDKHGIVYHAVCSGCDEGTGSTSDFPTTPGAHSRVNLSKNCNNAAFKFDLSSLRARFQTNNLALTMPGFDNICYPDTMRFENLSTGGEFYSWDFGDGTSIVKPKTNTAPLIHQYQAEGMYTVRLIAIDDNTCSEADTTMRTVHYFKDVIEFGEGADLCEGDEFQLLAGGGTTYTWTSDDKKFASSLANPTIRPADSTSYYISVTDSDGCTKSDTLIVNVIPGIDLAWQLELTTDCISRPVLSVKNTTEDATNAMLFFDFGDGTTSDEIEIVHEYEADGLYQVKLVGQREFCAFEKQKTLPIYTLFVPNVFTPESSPDKNDTFKIGIGENGHTPADIGLKVSLVVVDKWGKEVYQSNDYKNTWDAQKLSGGVYFTQLKVNGLAECKSWVHVVK